MIQAQAPDLPMETDFGQEVADPEGFLPASGDYTLEVNGRPDKRLSLQAVYTGILLKIRERCVLLKRSKKFMYTKE